MIFWLKKSAHLEEGKFCCVYFWLAVTGVWVSGSLGPVFIAATPDHWCAVDKGNFQNCTGDSIKTTTIPKEERDGEMVYSQCTMYSHNSSTFNSAHYCLSNESETTWNLSRSTQTKRCNKWEYATEYFSKTIVNQIR